MQNLRNIKRLAFTSFFNDIASESMLRLLPLFLSQVLGTSTTIIGLIEGIAESTATFTKLFSGWISDRLPRRKPLVVAGYALSGLTRPLLLIANHWTWVMFVRFSDRLSKGIRSAPRDALIADASPQNKRGSSFGLARALDTAGALLGLLITYFIVVRGGAVLTQNLFKTVILLTMIPAALAVAMVAFGVHESRRAHHSEKTANPIGGTLGSLPKAYWRYIAVLACFTLSNSSDAFLVLKASQSKGGAPFALLCLIALNLSSALVIFPVGKLSDRLGRKQLITMGWVIYAIAYVGFGLVSASSTLTLLSLFLLYGLFYGFTEGTERALVADLINHPQSRGLAYGVFGFTVGVFSFPSSLIFGVLVQHQGESFAFLCAAVLALIAATGLALLVPKS